VRRYAPWNMQVARNLIDERRSMPGAMLPILHALQTEFGYIHREAEPLIAQILNVTRAEVHGVVTFYHDFRRSPPGQHILKLCRAEACQSCGGENLVGHAEQRLGITIGETTADQRISLEPVYCLGLCAAAPAAMLDGRVVGRLDVEKLDALLAEAAR
jgi:formate dehydrogenase subunit gamma